MSENVVSMRHVALTAHLLRRSFASDIARRFCFDVAGRFSISPSLEKMFVRMIFSTKQFLNNKKSFSRTVETPITNYYNLSLRIPAKDRIWIVGGIVQYAGVLSP